MQLLFKREQFSGIRGRVKFKLWGKVELDDNEQEIVLRYTFDKAILIEAIQPGLLRKSLIVGIIAGILTYIIAIILFSFDGYIRLYSDTAVFSAMIASVAVGYWYYNDRRETIYVRDLIHGRYFTCNSVIDLARCMRRSNTGPLRRSHNVAAGGVKFRHFCAFDPIGVGRRKDVLSGSLPTGQACLPS